jgi:hypothetical protein
MIKYMTIISSIVVYRPLRKPTILGRFLLLQAILSDSDLSIEKKAAAREFAAASFLYPASSVRDQGLPVSNTPIHFSVRLKANLNQQTSQFVRPTLLPM